MRKAMGVLVASLAMASLATQAQAVQWYDEDTMTNYGHNGIYYTLATQPVAIPGGYRYVIDVFGVFMGGGQNHAVGGFERDDLLNLWDLTEPPWNFATGQSWRWEFMLFDFWASSTLDGTWDSPSYDIEDTNEWHENLNEPWGAPGHPVPGRLPEDYAPMAQSYHPVGVAAAGEEYLKMGPGEQTNTADEDMMCIPNTIAYGPFSCNGGLMMTFVLDSSEAYSAGDLTWSLPGYLDGVDWADSVWVDHPDYVEGLGVDFDHDGTNDVFHENHGLYAILGGGFLWPGAGDFDGDQDVDAADIDILCDNIGGDPAIYDVDGDGDVDGDDMVELIETLAQWDNGVDTGVGTKQGDFNLDGVVNATDLAIMKGTFGTSGVNYANGNANCDELVNATDLAILKGSFGFIAVPSPGGGVPEPATLTLLALGAAGLAAKRRRKS